jgi:small subunit ribosomal protein S4
MKTKLTCKMCRREGVSLCGREKCAVKHRPFPPGAHGPTSRTRPTGYGIQLREKQKAKRLYGINEKQFRRYFDEASKKKGDTGEFLVRTLELRLDNIVYRLGFAKTRAQARQFVNHGHVEVNGKKVDIPSFAVKSGQTVSLREGSKKSPVFAAVQQELEKQRPPSWLRIDSATLSGTVLSQPENEDLQQIFDPKMIVEFYSR